ncbi:MAG: hypothetical protein ISR65_15865 [Bacteriovoracaceae bacterium]|nr:hypothetical protein [Bacteriovoracaceae bacterium]
MVDWSTSDTGFTQGPSNCGSYWQELTASIPDGCTLVSTDYQSAGGYGSSSGAGQWSGGYTPTIYGETLSGTYGDTRRGGNYGSNLQAGVFTLNLNNFGGQTASVGFRCVYRP